MKNFLIKLLIFLLLLFILDRIIGSLCEYYFFKTRDGDTGGQINGLLEKKCQIVVFGSSRAESHYIPDILSNILNKTVFNAGFKGSNSIYDFGVEQLVLNTYKPELIIYDISQIQFRKNNFNIYNTLYPLYPFWQKPYIWELLKQKDPFEPLFFFSRIYPYNSKIHSIIIFNFIKSRPGAKNGYRPQLEIMRSTEQPAQSEDFGNLDSKLIDYFKEFILSAKKKGIKVIITRSPRYVLKGCDLPEDISNFLKKEEVPILDFNPTDYPQFLNYKLYMDQSHLNDNGAKILSSLLGQELKKLLKN